MRAIRDWFERFLALMTVSGSDGARGTAHGLPDWTPRDQGLIATLPVGVYRATTDGQILDANPACVRMLGYPDRETLLATHAAGLYADPLARGRWIATLERAGIVTDFESQLRRYDGSTIWVRAGARIVRTSGEAPYLEGVIADITDRKHAEAEQAQRIAELQAFYDLGRRLRLARDVGGMYPLIVEQAKSVLAAHHGCLALLNPEHHVFTRVYTVGVLTETAGSTFPADGTRSGEVVGGGAAFVSENFGREPVPDWMDAGQYRVLGPLALVPVRSEQEIIGTLCVARLRTSETRAFTEAELRLLEGIAELAGIAIQRARLHQNLQEAYGQMIVALTQATEVRDSYTAGHSERMGALAERVARELGCLEQEVHEIRWGARVHDIGKFGVPDAVLRKPAILTEEEWVVIRHHPVLGERILSSLERLHGVAKLVRHHHERWDGTGYPDGIKGNAIPLGARILAVVDAYGAITETRPYRPALTRAEALVEIRRGSGGQFDPRVVEAFSAVVGDLRGDCYIGGQM